MPKKSKSKRKRSRGEGKKGFTLIEMLVSIAILALILTMVHTVLISTLKARRMIHAATKVDRIGNRLLELGIVDPLAFFAACDVCVFPFTTSSIHHLPLAVLECFAAGTAVVSTQVGGIPEIVRTGKTGQSVRGCNTAELSHAIDTILDDRQTSKVGRKARSDKK